MLAKRVATLPDGDGWLFEPKWDGFRVLVFRDGEELYTQSRDAKPLDRYFPELARPLLEQLPERAVLDGELVIARGGALDFDALQLRLHPAASRVRLLSAELPASIVFWDLLAVGDEDLTRAPFAERRARLEAVLAEARPPIHLTPVTPSRALAADWFSRFEGAGLDGVMAKPLMGVYEPNRRAWKEWAPLDGTRVPGMKSRWSQDKDLSFVALKPERVVEVTYDHMQGTRFRHTAQFRRWRPDKLPVECTFEQLEVVAPMELSTIFVRG
jgi:ATP-dependent DNA ligase